MGKSTVLIRDRFPFLRRHKRWFSYLSTIVVFGTFIVNELLRNEAKDLADSIARARTSFVERSEIQAVGNDVKELTEDLQGIRNYLNHHGSTHKSFRSEDEAMAEGDRPIYLQSVASFDNIESLFLTLPYEKYLDDIRWELKQSLDLEGRFLDQTYLQSVLSDEGGKFAEDSEDKNAIMASRKRLSALFGLTRSNGNGITGPEAIQLFGRMVFSRAKDESESAQEKSELWKKISFGLYPLGLLIGLIGRIYGDHSDSEETAE